MPVVTKLSAFRQYFPTRDLSKLGDKDDCMQLEWSGWESGLVFVMPISIKARFLGVTVPTLCIRARL
jgi:hypothetical protein